MALKKWVREKDMNEKMEYNEVDSKKYNLELTHEILEWQNIIY